MANMSKCFKCSKNNLKVEQVPAEMLEEDISDDDTEYEKETVTYNHMCGDCNHMTSRHKVGEKLSMYTSVISASLVQVLAGRWPAGVPHGLSSVWLCRRQHLCHAK